MKDLFSVYVISLIESTFGFTPIVDINFTDEKVVKVVLDGDPLQKMEMMGQGAENFHAIKQLLRVFARRNGCISYFYVARSDYKFKE